MRTAAALGALALTAAIASGCGDDSATSSTPAALGATHALTSGGDIIATVRFAEVALLPAECVYDPLPDGAIAIAVRIEVANNSRHGVTSPDATTIGVNDAQGFTQDSTGVTLDSACHDQYPELDDPPAPGKVAGWEYLKAPANPTALVYEPLVWGEDTTLEDWKFIQVEPRQILIGLPSLSADASPSPGSSTPAPPSPTMPRPSTTPPIARPAVPAVGEACDVDGNLWAVDASGGQLHCTYAGTSSPRWVESLPFIGTREVGDPCTDDGVAEDLQGRPLICLGEQGWQPGP
ncbi:hypothetical protein IU487_22495 [Nocardia puris]|uniref:hypothetical protein n=1 Tax=Nocardia puris TaxID=208602 RepID=UPI001892D5A5|nr:hypothetical protein [Nocardia puris]MBF6213791.1 hypothetical protein [Nocardia puris]